MVTHRTNVYNVVFNSLNFGQYSVRVIASTEEKAKEKGRLILQESYWTTIGSFKSIELLLTNVFR